MTIPIQRAPVLLGRIQDPILVGDVERPASRTRHPAGDGTPHLVGDFLTGELVSGATMASGGDARDVRILYWGVPPGGDPNTDGGPFWWRYAPAGQVPPSTFDSPVGFYPPPPGVAFGDDTVVLFGRELGDGFGVARLASDGRVVSPYRDLFRNPLSYAFGAKRSWATAITSH